jgi:dihydrofolate synthase/folylpolyglutamate synthase
VNYQATLDWIYSLMNFNQRGASGVPPVLSLDRIRALLNALGNPHTRFKSIHVAGTKGKGSTSAMLASALQKNGAKTGLFTSPHLHTFRERIRVDGHLIDQASVVALAEKVRGVVAPPASAPSAEPASAEAAPPPNPLADVTTFEVITAMAFLHFAAENVEWAVIEVGLGGRWDPTNIIAPAVSVITSISYDHTNWLGKTLTEIAGEKGGIIKPDTPVVIQQQPPEVTAVFDKIAREQNAPAAWLGRHWRWTAPGMAATRGVQSDLPAPATSLASQQFLAQQVAFVRSKNKPWLSDLEGWYEIPLLGKHQLDNATAVIAAMQALREQGVVVSARAVHEGLRAVSWPGRFEVLRSEPPLVIDGAHNVDSVNKLAVTLAESFPGRRWTFVFGCLADKDAEGMMRALKPRSLRWIMTQSDSKRAIPADTLLAMAQKLNLRAIAVPDVAEAVRMVENTNEAVCITGSLTIIADARYAWIRSVEGRWIEKD